MSGRRDAPHTSESWSDWLSAVGGGSSPSSPGSASAPDGPSADEETTKDKSEEESTPVLGPLLGLAAWALAWLTLTLRLRLALDRTVSGQRLGSLSTVRLSSRTGPPLQGRPRSAGHGTGTGRLQGATLWTNNQSNTTKVKEFCVPPASDESWNQRQTFLSFGAAAETLCFLLRWRPLQARRRGGRLSTSLGTSA